MDFGSGQGGKRKERDTFIKVFQLGASVWGNERFLYELDFIFLVKVFSSRSEFIRTWVTVDT